MGNIIQLRTDESLVQVLKRIESEVAESMKKIYNLKEIKIHGTVASQIAAARLNGKNTFNFKIRKNGLSSGILELL